ncbi:metal-dependent transcriptional regulator [Antarcticibacterium flavum]|uniref:Transcriptional regulator MntR n=1 Tax=Antarcticibacterium flavum TaxID=2058175 RepID=A0A5B7X1N9_9FLAO|nr:MULTISPECIES: metal-dependent transcriptional regulator [Antarcticibacterium]MCM4159071.1 iron-dependent repressor [Antarcticibacterium sp. W02-3]QCY69474.1 metal-dependent transcriptional regulator [Antarcticibacterium flavum]
MYTFSEENYLKAIFHLERMYPAGVSTNALAEQMDTKASSVTDMIKKLSDKDLVNYRKYQGVKLSKAGKHTAVTVIRKHRLWEVFLVEKLGFNWDEVHDVAEQLEHIQSEKLIKELDRFLEFPKRDPHGDPIPDAEGNFTVFNKVLLADLDKGEAGICVGVKDSSPAFLQFLDKHRIALGKEIKVLEKEDFDQSMKIKLEKEELRISHQISGNLFIKTA